MAYGSGRKEDERYCYFCMAILPTKPKFETDILETTARFCIRCSNDIEPPESNTEQE